MVRKSLNSLAGKLIIAVGALMTIGSIVFGFIFIRYEENIMMDNLVSYASSTADLVKRGIEHSMLTAHRETIAQTVQVVASGSEIRDILVHNKKGTVVYSSNPSEIGRFVDKGSVSC